MQHRDSSQRKLWVIRLASILAIVTAWSILIKIAEFEKFAQGGIIDRQFLPSPREVLHAFASSGVNKILPAALATLGLTATGFGIGTLLGFVIGSAMGLRQAIDASLGMLVDFARAIPAAGLLPLALLFLPRAVSRTAVVSTAVALVIAVACRSGIRNASIVRRELFRSLGFSDFATVSKLLLFEMLSEFFVGCRIAISLAFVLAVVLEMLLGTMLGLGELLLNAQVQDRALMFAVLITLGFIGLLLNGLLTLVQTHLSRLGVVQSD